MKQNKKVGIILLVLAALAIMGGFANGTFSNFSDENIMTIIGFVAAFVVLVVIGLMKIFGKKQ